jgi:chromosome partitioning protein
MSTIISLASAKGGTGKTTAALAFASSLASLFSVRRVALVDLDPEGYATTMGLGRDLVADPIHAEPAVVAIAPSRDALLFPAGQSIAHASESQVAQHIQRAASAADIVVIDTPPTRTSASVRAALRAATIVVTPVLPELQSYAGFTRVLADSEAMGISAPVVALFSRWEARTVVARDIYTLMLAKQAQRKLHPIVPRDQRVVESMVRATPVSLFAPKSPASDAYRLAAIELAHLVNLAPTEVTV